MHVKKTQIWISSGSVYLDILNRVPLKGDDKVLGALLLMLAGLCWGSCNKSAQGSVPLGTGGCVAADYYIGVV